MAHRPHTGPPGAAPTGMPAAAGRGMFDLDSNDPRSEMIDRAGLSAEEVAEIGELMNAFGELRKAEQALSEASRRYMKLNETDMRALHFLIVAGHREELSTPGALAAHLRISSAATTKLLDRLERDGHITREPHPTDRRALSVAITPTTRLSAMETVGKQQSRRFYAAARLTSEERAIVTRFVRDMAAELSAEGEPWPEREA